MTKLHLFKQKVIVLVLIIVPIIIKAQVRQQDINSLTPSEQTQLGNLILDYLSEEVIGTHGATMVMPTPVVPPSQLVHSNINFLPFHREYIAGLEDYLVLRNGNSTSSLYPPGTSPFVPLPKWAPENSIPAPFEQISPDCDNAYPGYFCPPLPTANIVADGSRAFSSYFTNPNLCSYTYSDIMGSSNSISIFESPWHNNVHNNIGGTMASGKSPGAAIFMPWHAYVDDVWKEWECDCDNAPAVDLWMRDTPMKLGNLPQNMHTMSMDRGIEPNTQSVPSYMWISEDIWVRNNNDGFSTDKTDAQLEYSSTDPLYVYVRVRNKGCQNSTGNETLNLRWAKAATALAWPNHWDGSSTIGGPTGPSAGDVIGTQLINAVKAGGSRIIEFEWYPPNPDSYIGLNPEKWHFCLLARVVANNDPMTYPETSDLNGNVTNNNNIVWKNVTIINDAPGIVGNDLLPGGVVAIGNVFEEPETFDFEFLSLDFEDGEIYSEAEVLITLDELSWDKWIEGGQLAENIDVFSEGERRLIVTANNAWLRNLSFEENQRTTMQVSFNFLTEEVTDHPEFDYHVVQKRAEDQKIIGGEMYRIVKSDPESELFLADGGGDESIAKEESVQLTASDIGEPAVYNWYNKEGDLVHTGKTYTVTPEMTEKYKLEVIAESDGYKDYDEVTVNVKEHEIVSLSPNPASNDVTIGYDIQNATSAYLQFVMPFGSTSSQYILDLTMNEIIINVSNYQTGTYNVVLVVDGQAVDSKNLSVQ